MERVMLITPPYHCGVVESAGRWPNLGFIYIAGELRRAGFDVNIYDAMSRFHDYDQIRAEIEAFKPDCIGMTAITATINECLKVLSMVRDIDPNIVTLLGGVHPTFCYDEILRDNHDVVDYCVIGEGEQTAPELLLAVSKGESLDGVRGVAYREGNKVVVTPPRPMLTDLDALHPAWDMVNWSDYPLYFIDNSHVAILSSSRGCIYSCSFCSQHRFWKGTYRERDPVSFTDEIEMLHRTYGINVFFIGDEFPTRNAERWERILDILIEKSLPIHLLMETHVDDIIRDGDIMWKYRKAGMLFIYTGVEAVAAGRLEVFKKDISFERSRDAIALIKGAGMISETSLILGMPDETKESIRETFELAKIYNPDYMHFLMIAPWPYADLYKELEPYIEEYDYAKYNLVSPVVKPTNMTRDEVFSEVLRCYRNYYMGKIPQWLTMTGNDLKRSCLIKGMKAIMNNSFLKDHMKGAAKMPANILKMLNSLDKTPPKPNGKAVEQESSSRAKKSGCPVRRFLSRR